MQQLLEEVTRQGSDFVGLNPLNALYPATPDLQPLIATLAEYYLHQRGAAGRFPAERGGAAQKWWKAMKTQRALAKVRDSEFVDYKALMALKLATLHQAWTQFSQCAEDDPQRQAFADFVRDGGASLHKRPMTACRWGESRRG